MTSHARSTETAKRSALYRAAALRCEMEKQWGACVYIWFAGGRDTDLTSWSNDPEVDRFKAVFKPKNAGDLWWKDNDPRILALCLMAAMVEAGDA